jgi:hypothetical protein
MGNQETPFNPVRLNDQIDQSFYATGFARLSNLHRD